MAIPRLFIAADMCGNFIAGGWVAPDICSASDILAF
jgi:hypothetical protein